MKDLKIILIGPIGVGKTTLRKVFFEQENPLKLLNQTLEPTRGVETKIYDLGGSVAIHDLAGQQLEEWFSSAYDLFSESDLIIVVLDARDDWEENRELWERVNFQRLRACPGAHLMIMFHKMDQLDETARQKMDWDIEMTFMGNPEISAFTSSFIPEFFLQTYKKFVLGLRQCVLSIREVGFHEVFQRVDILSRFIDRSTLELSDLVASLRLPGKVAMRLLEDMYKQNLIQANESARSVTLGERGMLLINELSNAGIHAAKPTFREIPLVKGVLFSDHSGICFYIYEYKRGFFEQLLPSGEHLPAPSLVSGFMTAIGGFAAEIGQNLNSINLTGMASQVSSQKFETLIAFFSWNPSRITSPCWTSS